MYGVGRRALMYVVGLLPAHQRGAVRRRGGCGRSRGSEGDAAVLLLPSLSLSLFLLFSSVTVLLAVVVVAAGSSILLLVV